MNDSGMYRLIAAIFRQAIADQDVGWIAYIGYQWLDMLGIARARQKVAMDIAKVHQQHYIPLSVAPGDRVSVPKGRYGRLVLQRKQDGVVLSIHQNEVSVLLDNPPDTVVTLWTYRVREVK